MNSKKDMLLCDRGFKTLIKKTAAEKQITIIKLTRILAKKDIEKLLEDEKDMFSLKI